MIAKLAAAATLLVSAGVLACADTALPRHEPPTATPTPEPQRIHLMWAERICAFAPSFEAAVVDWERALHATQARDFEAMKDALTRQVSFDLQSMASSNSQWLGLLARATTSEHYWFGNPSSTAPPGVAGYEHALFALFRDFEPVLNYAEAEIRQARLQAELEATHASVMAAQERMLTSIREAAVGLPPEALVALRSVDECGYILAPPN